MWGVVRSHLVGQGDSREGGVVFVWLDYPYLMLCEHEKYL